MLIVGYDWTDRYDQMFHIGAGRVRDRLSELEMALQPEHLLVQADGDELEKISDQFVNLPITTGRVVRWQGEMARFIVNNLNL